MGLLARMLIAYISKPLALRPGTTGLGWFPKMPHPANSSARTRPPHENFASGEPGGSPRPLEDSLGPGCSFFSSLLLSVSALLDKGLLNERVVPALLDVSMCLHRGHALHANFPLDAWLLTDRLSSPYFLRSTV